MQETSERYCSIACQRISFNSGDRCARFNVWRLPNLNFTSCHMQDECHMQDAYAANVIRRTHMRTFAASCAAHAAYVHSVYVLRWMWQADNV